jgi:hypothetical protein
VVVDQSFRVRWLNVSGWGSSGGNLTTDYTDYTDGTDGTDEEETCKNIREIRVIRG